MKRNNLKIFVGFFLAALFSVTAKASIETYFGLPFGTLHMMESNSGNYVHNGAFFGHLGLGLGTRLKYQMGPLGLGGIAEFSWVGDSLERKPESTSPAVATNYRNDLNRTLLGGTVTWNFAEWFRGIGEYYPIASSKVIYADEKVENPWRKNDTITATGWGAGVQFKFAKFVMTFLYRSLATKDLEIAGASYSPYKTEEGTATFGLEF